MSEHLTEERRHDYLDGLLPEAERSAAAAHLAACAECEAQVRELAVLLAALAALPRGISPGVDLRPAIHARIEARRRPVRLAIAAGIVLTLLSAGVLARWPGETGSPRPPAVARATELQALEEDYRRATRELLDALATRSDELDPAAATLLRRHLQVIDAAIQETRDALHRDPQSDALWHLLLAGHERKLEILRRAADLGITT